MDEKSPFRPCGRDLAESFKSTGCALYVKLYWFIPNNALDATQWQPAQNAKKFPFKQNQFGATFGGPIIENKLFFFADYQGFRSSTPANTTTPPSPPT